MTRRRALGLLTISAGGAACGTWLSQEEETPEEREEREQLELIRDFEWGDIRHDDAVGQRLLDINKLVAPKTPYGPVALPRRIHKKHIEPWLQKEGLARFATQADITTAVAVGKLIKLDEYGSTFYRCHGIGASVNSKVKTDPRRNDQRYIYLHPHAEKLIEEIDKRVNKALSAIGFPNRYWVRLVVTSATRPADYPLRNMSETSSHQYGVAFDLSRLRFDIIDTETNTFYGVPDKRMGVNDHHSISWVCYSALSRVLDEMHEAGYIFAMLEGNPPHIHVTDRQYSQPL